MKTYNIKIRFISDYLQARFSEKAQDDLTVTMGKKGFNIDSDSWKEFLYQDKEGIYIPSIQFKMALVNAGKAIKMKPYGSLKNIVKAYFFIEPENIYIGKQKPDYINTSYPALKNGMRVKKLHPAFKKGLEASFKLNCTTDIDKKTVDAIVSKSGLEYGVGAWRPEHGRFEVLKID